MHSLAARLRRQIAEGRPVLGTHLVEFVTAGAVHALAGAGFDFMAIDCEHGNHDPTDFSAMFEAGWAAQIPIIVRTADDGRDLITRSLDAGAAGVLVPAIDTLEQVDRVVRASKYAPIGRRGVHLFRGHTQYRSVDAKRFIEEANRDVLTLIQIELRGALEIVDEIAATEGVDGLYVGPADLSVDLGVPGEPDSPVVQNAIRRVTDACKKSGKIMCCHLLREISSAKALHAVGVQLFGYDCDLGMFAKAADRAASEFSAALGIERTAPGFSHTE